MSAERNAWTSTADKARLLLPREVEHGRRQSLMAEIASGLGLTRQTLRKILSADAFVQRIRSLDREDAEVLSRLSYSAVEIYDRWHAYDPVAAI